MKKILLKYCLLIFISTMSLGQGVKGMLGEIEATKNGSASGIASPYSLHKDSEKDLSKNQWGIDYHGWGASIHYARRIRNSFYLGGEIGFLPDPFDRVILANTHFTEENTIWSSDRSEASKHNLNQFFFTHFFVRWKPIFNWLEIDLGIKRAKYLNAIPYEDSFGYPVFYGAYFKPSFGLKRLKLGVRTDIGYITANYLDEFEFIMIASPFFRFNFKK